MILSDRPILAMMGGQITIWAALFYSFPALVLDWQAEFGWTTSQIMGAFTLAISLYALGSPIYGRLIDRGMAWVSLPGGAILGAQLLLMLRGVDGLVEFYLIWALIGICMGLTLYEACFAIVTRARNLAARGAITAIALVAGFASSLAYPLIAVLGDFGGWRFSVAVLAAMILLINVPLVIYATRRLEAQARSTPPPPEAPAPAPRLLRDPRFWSIAAGFALASFATGALLSHLFPLMAAQGVSDAVAITAAALIGPSQVVGRLLMTTFGRNTAAVHIAQLGMMLLAIGAVFMAGAAALAALAYGFAIAQGAGYGVVGILRAVVTREVLGQRNYGAIAGAVSLPALLAFALAPFLSALIADAFGYGLVVALCIAAPLLGAACLLALPRN